ncbi:MAG: hypothetical protein ABR991_13635, partial [Terracidiphilus sp.]
MDKGVESRRQAKAKSLRIHMPQPVERRIRPVGTDAVFVPGKEFLGPWPQTTERMARMQTAHHSV